MQKFFTLDKDRFQDKVGSTYFDECNVSVCSSKTDSSSFSLGDYDQFFSSDSSNARPIKGRLRILSSSERFGGQNDTNNCKRVKTSKKFFLYVTVLMGVFYISLKGIAFGPNSSIRAYQMDDIGNSRNSMRNVIQNDRTYWEPKNVISRDASGDIRNYQGAWGQYLVPENNENMHVKESFQDSFGRKTDNEIVHSDFTNGNGLDNLALKGFKDVRDKYEPTDVPVFFHIPKSGGTTIKNILGTCYRLTMATEVGVVKGHERDKEISVVRPYANPMKGKDGSPFVNVDTTTSEGLSRARKMKMAESGLVECMVTPLLYEAETLFTSHIRGRIFTIFRHPLERAVSMYYYIQIAEWETSFNPEVKDMSLEDYATSTFVEDNWMVRRLTNVGKSSILTLDNLERAKEIVQQKFLVGLLSKKEETLDRFEKFFGWSFHVQPENQEQCRKDLLETGANINIHNEIPEVGTVAYDALVFHNKWDILLYEFVEDLFLQQAVLVENISDRYRLRDATCAKCVPPTFPNIQRTFFSSRGD